MFFFYYHRTSCSVYRSLISPFCVYCLFHHSLFLFSEFANLFIILKHFFVVIHSNLKKKIVFITRITGNLPLNYCILMPFIGCGFIGRHLVSYLINNGLVSHIRVVDKTPPLLAWLNNQHMTAFNDKAVEFCSANLINQGQCKSSAMSIALLLSYHNT